MKKFLATLLAATMALGAAPCAFAADQITVTVNGEKVNFKDQQPVNIDGRVMVPMRDVAEKMGWEVEWFTYYGDTLVDGLFQKEHSAIFTKMLVSTDRYMAGYHSSLNIEDKTKNKSIWGATVNLVQGEDVPVSAPPQVVNDRTLVGIRDLADCMYADAQWDAKTRTVAITTTPTEQLPKYNEILASVAEVEKQTPSKPQETKPTPTIEEEQRQTAEKNEADQNTKSEKYAEEVIDLINKEREKEGLNPLQIDETLMKAANVRVKEISSKFSHTRPNGENYISAATEAGYPSSYVGENIVARADSPERAVKDWSESKDHKKNYMKSEYTYTGVAYLYDKDSEYGSYWVQLFAD